MKRLIYLFFIPSLLLCSCSSLSNDYLVYIINKSYDEPRHLVFYDPFINTHTPLLVDWEIDHISLSGKNRLAFTSSREGKSNIYILDYPFTNNTPINITSETSAEYNLFSWSPDGHYLAFESVRGDEKTLYIWDGRNTVEIHRYREAIGEITWSLDGRLAFTEFYTFTFPYSGDATEIFIWDGNSTTSVSQNPTGGDRQPAWSKDGKLAFLSERDGKYEIFTWDGVSKNKSVPIIDLHKNTAQVSYYSSPTWTNSGSLTFCATESADEHHFVQIFEWNGRATTNISQNPNMHSCGQTWRSDGYWSFVTFFSGEQLVYVRNNTNQTILKTKGQYAPTWGPNGLLTFCTPDISNDWILSMWDGDSVLEITRGYFILAMWNNGEYVFCSHG
jgi:Tol biopolymer transport system component